MSINKLKFYRKKEKMTQQELATMLNVTKDYISIIERGRQTPSLLLAKQIADLFCTTIEDIFFNDELNKSFDNQCSA